MHLLYLMKVKGIFIWISILPFVLQAQDIHFSQFQNSPLTLNPAFAGSFDGNVRGVLNHRNQWSSVSIPYLTSAISFDSRNWEDRLRGDVLGLGVLFFHDQAGDGNLTQLRVMANAAYHKQMDEEGNAYLTLGAQGGMYQKSIDQNKLVFASQFQDFDFDNTIASQENFGDLTVLKPDFHVGLLYDWQDPGQWKFNAGIGFFHLTQPDQSFFELEDRLTMRYQGHVVYKRLVSQNIALGPAAVVRQQNKAKEIILGTLVEYTMESESPENVNLQFGGWFRATGSDAFILSTGIAYKNWQGVLSYDFNISSLHLASNYRGGFEISFIYQNRLLIGKGSLPEIIPCERL